ncbi:hypothetical protein WJX84_001412 [Apatococcus fuscideae]|uniref:Uncharacterized protein n=1 Tax=Apatococcus fuscideae TaxID=2026836 RepID=A0AAW1T063_9CHLO
MPTCQTRGLCLAVLFFQVVGVCRAALGSGHFTADFVAAYAPLVYLHPEETFLPSSIDFGLEFEQVLFNNTLALSSSGGHQPSPLNDSNLNFQAISNARNSYLTTQQALGCDTCQNPAFLRGLDPTSSSVPVYAIVIQRDDNTTSIYYWTFYPFNLGKDVGLCFNNLPEALLGSLASKVTSALSKVFGSSSGSSSPSITVNGPDATLFGVSSQATGKCQGFQQFIGNHVGDWEHVEVKFDTRTSPPTPESVRLSQHDGGQIFDWGDPKLGLHNGTHPIAFSANGSHALYASTGIHQYTNMTILDTIVGLTDSAGQGKAWDTSEEIVLATWRSDFNYSGDQSWLAWPGYWGDQASGCDSNPITALIQKASHECPLSSGLQGPAYYMGPNIN